MKKLLLQSLCAVLFMVVIWGCGPSTSLPTTVGTVVPTMPETTHIAHPTMTRTVTPAVLPTESPVALTPTFTPTTEPPEQIAFVWESPLDPGTRSIYVMDATVKVSNLVNLTHANGWWDTDPSFSPDGTKIAFISNRDEEMSSSLYIMNADGSDIQRKTHQLVIFSEPSWSPDSTQIVFSAKGVGGGLDILVIDLETSMIINLTSSPTDESTPAWSPQGDKIAFASNRDTGPLGNWGLYVMDVQGKNIVRLTNTLLSAADPDWSPDGARVAYTLLTNQAPVICVVNADGSGQTQLLEGGFKGGSNPDWSPDGSKIAFQDLRIIGGQYSGWYISIYIMNADGSNITRLSNGSPDHSFHASEPDWRP